MMNFTSRQEAEAGHRVREHKGDCGHGSQGVMAVVPEGPASCSSIALLPFLSKWVPISLLTKSSHVTQFWTPECWQHSVQGVRSKKILKGKKYALFFGPVLFLWLEWVQDIRSLCSCGGGARYGDSRTVRGKKVRGPSWLCRDSYSPRPSAFRLFSRVTGKETSVLFKLLLFYVFCLSYLNIVLTTTGLRSSLSISCVEMLRQRIHSLSSYIIYRNL